MMGTSYLTLEELMARFKIGRSTVYEWMGLGLPFFKVGRVVRYPEKEVQDWIGARTTGVLAGRSNERKAA
jgi:excisionase family DNA binding protein